MHIPVDLQFIIVIILKTDGGDDTAMEKETIFMCANQTSQGYPTRWSMRSSPPFPFIAWF
jgi:hypothetical protein